MPRESKAARLKRMHDEYAVLCQVFPEPKCALDFDSPFQLVVATVLSAQTTDRRVNTVTPTLFAQYPTAAALVRATVRRPVSSAYGSRRSPGGRLSGSGAVPSGQR